MVLIASAQVFVPRAVVEGLVFRQQFFQPLGEEISRCLMPLNTPALVPFLRKRA